MHNLEPYYNWRRYYAPEEDAASPFAQQDENAYRVNKVYNYVIHPDWEFFGSPTLYLKIIFADYKNGIAIIEMIGEWNDCIQNDVMYLKREVIEPLMKQGISRFVLIGENVLNFHAGEDDYYEEWFEEVSEEGGWIAAINFREHLLDEIRESGLDRFLQISNRELPWRTFSPEQLGMLVAEAVGRKITAGT